MTNDPFQIAVLIQKSIGGVLTGEERSRLDRWIAESDEHQRIYRELIQAGFMKEARKEHSQFQAGKGYYRFLAGKQKVDRQRIGKRWMSVAAVGVLVIGMALTFLFRAQVASDDVAPLPVTEMIKPGKTTAVLTLSDGKQVILSDSLYTRLKEQTADIHVQGRRLDYSSGDSGVVGGYNTITVPRGGEYQLTLADGTGVWLNAESVLKYPVAFRGGNREVELRGEAYFEVVKSADHPFIVKTVEMEVEVLGTSFNVCAYEEEKVQTTLVEGRVRVQAGEKKYMLKPGQQLSREQNGGIVVREVDVESYVAWKNRRFVFEDDRLEEVLRKLERWYNVAFFIQDNAVREVRFTGDLPKYEELNKVLNKLELLTYIHFEQRGKTVIVREEK